MPDDANLLFVYGTLRPSLAAGESARLVHDLDLLGPATTPGVLVDLGDYPGLIGGDGIVHGDLLRIADPARLQALDADEECGGPAPLFQRERTVVRLPDGTTMGAWVYRYARPSRGAVIAGGDYASHGGGR